MLRSHHFAGYDFECEDDDDPEPVGIPSAARGNVHRRIRLRRIVGAASGVTEQMFVSCPRQGTPTFEHCAACPRFRSYLLEPTGRSGFVTCSDEPGPGDVGDATRLSAHTALHSVMRDAVCVRSDVTVETLAALFIKHRISGAPVVDAEGRPVGVVSKTDIVRGASPGTRVAEIMSLHVQALPESSSIAEAAALMTRRAVHRVPVVSKAGAVVGMVTSFDVARCLAGK